MPRHFSHAEDPSDHEIFSTREFSASRQRLFAAEYSRVGSFVAGANEENFDRLAAHLTTMVGRKA